MTTRDAPWPAGTPCWVDMAAQDARSAQGFYGPLLGWDFHDTGERLGHYLLCTAGGRNAAALYRPMPGADPMAWTVYLAAPDAGEALARVTAHGGSVVAEPLQVPGVGAMALAADPCGAVIGIWEQSGMVGFAATGEPGTVASCDARLSDPAAGRAFYGAVFGWTFAPGAGDTHVAHVEGLPVSTIGPAVDGSSRWLVTFAVADPEAATRRVLEGGGRLVETGEGRCADPDGVPFLLRGAGA